MPRTEVGQRGEDGDVEKGVVTRQDIADGKGASGNQRSRALLRFRTRANLFDGRRRQREKILAFVGGMVGRGSVVCRVSRVLASPRSLNFGDARNDNSAKRSAAVTPGWWYRSSGWMRRPLIVIA
jgi:hypothetical protein